MDYVGIDLHKMESQICVMSEHGEVLQECRVATRRDALAQALSGRGGARVLVEACCESEWVAQHLEQLGHNVVVGDPNYTAMYGHRHRKYKTDRRDACALAAACAQGLYRPAHRRSAPRREVRAELIVRDTLVRTRTRMVNVVRALLRAEGWRLRSGDISSFVVRVRELGVADPLGTRLEPLLTTLAGVSQEIREADRRLERVAGTDPVVVRIQSAPLVGPVTALAYVVALDDVARFRDAHEVESYLGLVPRERSSGEHQVRGNITRTGDKRVRWLLVEAAWRLMRSRRPEVVALQQWTARIATRRGRSVAAVALARRLAGILYAMWRDGVSYDRKRFMGATTTATA